MSPIIRFLIPALLVSLTLGAASAEGADNLAQSFAKQIQPLLVKTCGK